MLSTTQRDEIIERTINVANMQNIPNDLRLKVQMIGMDAQYGKINYDQANELLAPIEQVAATFK